jgi:hypothetical protein
LERGVAPPLRQSLIWSALVIPFAAHYLLGMIAVSPFLGFALSLIIPGALVILLAALLWTGR